MSAPEAALNAVREHLARDGAVYLFGNARHYAPERARELRNELADRLREGGFSVDRVLVEDLRPVPAVCAIGRPQGGDRAGTDDAESITSERVEDGGGAEEGARLLRWVGAGVAPGLELGLRR